MGCLADADQRPGVSTRPADLQTVPPATPWHTLLPTLDALRRHRTALDPTPPRDRRGPPRSKPGPRPGHTYLLHPTPPPLVREALTGASGTPASLTLVSLLRPDQTWPCSPTPDRGRTEGVWGRGRTGRSFDVARTRVETEDGRTRDVRVAGEWCERSGRKVSRTARGTVLTLLVRTPNPITSRDRAPDPVTGKQIRSQKDFLATSILTDGVRTRFRTLRSSGRTGDGGPTGTVPWQSLWRTETPVGDEEGVGVPSTTLPPSLPPLNPRTSL